MKRGRWGPSARGDLDIRLEVFRYALVAFAGVIVLKLVVLQVLEHDYYEALASGQHELFQELIPERGDIYLHDYKDETIVPVATNEELAFIWADPRLVDEPDDTA